MEVHDLEAQRSLPVRAALAATAKATHSTWQLSPVNLALSDRRVRRQLRRTPVDAALGLAETDPPPGVPSFLYRDMDCRLALEERSQPYGRYVNVVAGSSDDELRRMGERQSERAAQAGKVLAMSGWYASWLQKRGIVDAAHVAVVGAGITNVGPIRGEGPGADRVLFVGVEFERKGGDLVVAACERLRRSGSRPVTLTVVGPERWPGADPPPEWLRFLGNIDAPALSNLFAKHDVFALPSRYEAYGIALLEARAAGLPCVARRAMAMPEIVPPEAGRLVDDDDVDALAEAIDACLADGDLAARARAAAPSVRAHHSWAAVAERVASEVRASLP